MIGPVWPHSKNLSNVLYCSAIKAPVLTWFHSKSSRRIKKITRERCTEYKSRLPGLNTHVQKIKSNFGIVMKDACLKRKALMREAKVEFLTTSTNVRQILRYGGCSRHIYTIEIHVLRMCSSLRQPEDVLYCGFLRPFIKRNPIITLKV